MCLYLWICFVELAYPSCFQSLSVWSSARYGYGEARAEMFIPRDGPMVWNLICPTKLAVNFGIPRFWRKPRWNWNILKPPNQFDRTTPWPAVLPHRPSAPPTGASLSLQHFHLLGGSYDPIWSNPTWTRKGGNASLSLITVDMWTILKKQSDRYSVGGANPNKSTSPRSDQAQGPISPHSNLTRRWITATSCRWGYVILILTPSLQTTDLKIMFPTTASLSFLVFVSEMLWCLADMDWPKHDPGTQSCSATKCWKRPR